MRGARTGYGIPGRDGMGGEVGLENYSDVAVVAAVVVAPPPPNVWKIQGVHEQLQKHIEFDRQICPSLF